MKRRAIATLFALVTPLVILLEACDVPTAMLTAVPADGTVIPALPTATVPGATGLDRVPYGTWGGDDVALVHEADRAHLHWGCVVGDISFPMTLDASGNFDLQGTYNPDAYPVDKGTQIPARYSGSTDGKSLTITVTDTQSGERFGPFTVVLGQEARMRQCPICAPGEMEP